MTHNKYSIFRVVCSFSETVLFWRKNSSLGFETMKAVLLRTGSVPVFVPGSPRVSLSVHDSTGGVPFSSSGISLKSGFNRGGIRRVFSESDVIHSEIDFSDGAKKLSASGSRSFPPGIPEEEDYSCGGVQSLTLADIGYDTVEWPGSSGISVKELGFPGDGTGNYSKSGGDDDQSKISTYYQEMLKLNPSHPLLLRNYGKYLHEVEGDLVKAEEYYGRAILASPGDGEVLSLYGKLMWEAKGDEDRAKCYFDQAIHASPDDCTVLGSYAHFMWEAGEDEEVDDNETERERKIMGAVIEAF